ncbi:histidine phosphatase family protein [Oscillatoria sp. CS-180]|nr:histidine phosphatase family protein [Oscillatoria sp. CS-180]
MLKLLFIRHGESFDNREGRMSSRDDGGLTAEGQQQCRSLATELHRCQWQPSHIYTSPLQRALATAQLLMTPWHWQLVQTPATAEIAHPVPIPLPLVHQEAQQTTDPLPIFSISHQLEEFNAGILAGLTWTDAQRQYPELCQALETSQEWIPIPKAETPLEGRSRANQFITHLLNSHSNQDAVWIISHHWIMEHLIACLMGCDRTWKIDMPNTALFEFWVDCDRCAEEQTLRGISDFWQIKQFNNCQHWANASTIRSTADSAQ